MTETGRRYPTGDRELATAIVETVAAVKDKDPLELEPLYDAVNPEALETVIDGLDTGSVTITVGGVDLTIDSSKEIVIGKTRRQTAVFDTPSSGLVIAPDGVDDEYCSAVLSDRPAAETNLLGITYGHDAYDCLSRWEDGDGQYPANTTVVAVGAGTRAASADRISTVDFPPDPYTITTVTHETDFAAVGRIISEQLSAWESSDNRTVLCFHSITDLLDHVDEATAFKFLHVLASRLESSEVLAHFHIDPEMHDEKTIRLFSELFDPVVETDGDGAWVVNPR